MRKELNIFADPKTQEPLKLKIGRKRDDHIISGKLFNSYSKYPIIRGIPRFVDESFYKEIPNDSEENQTTKSFGAKWREKRSESLGSSRQDVEDLKEQFMAMLGCESESQLENLFKKAKRSLNAGCGVAWSEYLFNYNPKAERHCIDISLSVEVAYKKRNIQSS